jgi:hypothetical protein
MRTTIASFLAGGFAAAALLVAASCETSYKFDPVPVGDDGSERAPRARTNTQYVRGLYTDLVGRAPESYDIIISDAAGTELGRFPVAEQEFLLFTLDGVGDPAPLRSLIAAGLVRSAEVVIPEKDDVGDPAEFVSEQFRKFLGREPNPYELDAFVAEWEGDPAVGPRTVIRALVASREYQSY